MAAFEVRSQRAQIEDLLQVEKMLATLATFFSLTAAALAALGLYGVLSFLVSQRQKGIGIRLALGARRATVPRMVAGEAWRPIGAGILGGVLRAVASRRSVATIVYGVRPLDAATLAGGSAVMAAIATLAVMLPARRAARVDPITALRET